MNAMGSQMRTRAGRHGQSLHSSRCAQKYHHLPNTDNCRIGNADQSSPAPLRCRPCKQAGRLNIVTANPRKEKTEQDEVEGAQASRSDHSEDPASIQTIVRAQFQREARGKKYQRWVLLIPPWDYPRLMRRGRKGCGMRVQLGVEAGDIGARSKRGRAF